MSKEVNENNMLVCLLLVDHFVADIDMKSFSVKSPVKHNTGNFLQLFILTMEGITQTFATSSQTCFLEQFVIHMLETPWRPTFKDSRVRVKQRDELGGRFP